MDLFIGVVMLAFFLATVIFIMKGESPILSLLALAILWAVLAGVPLKGGAGKDILSGVLDKGGTAFASAIIIIIFGAWFGQALVKTHIAENIIRGAIELAGDRPVVVAMVVSLVTFLLFSSLYGVGAAIAIGVIALPIMMSVGIPPWVAAPVFSMAIGAGDCPNLVNFNIMKPLFPGITYAPPYVAYYWIVGVVCTLFACAMSFYQLKIRGIRKYSAVNVSPPAPARVRIPWYAYFAPAVPVVLVITLNVPMIPAFLAGTFYALAVTHAAEKRTFRESVDLFHRTFYDAFPDIATMAALWIICGMIIVCGEMPAVQKTLSPVFTPILPATPLGAAIFFAALAPLTLYRGPLHAIGTGAVLLAMFLNAKMLSPVYLYCVWLGPWCLGCGQDPTVSWTLWTIGYTKVSHKQFLQTALPWGWLMAATNAFVAYFMVPFK